MNVGSYEYIIMFKTICQVFFVAHQPSFLKVFTMYSHLSSIIKDKHHNNEKKEEGILEI